MRLIFVTLFCYVFYFPLLGNGFENIKNVFIANNSQVTDQFGNQRSDVLYIMQTNEMKILLHKNGFSYIIENLESEESNILSNAKQIHHNFKVNINSYRLDFNFPEAANTLPENIFANSYVAEMQYYNTRKGEPVFTKAYNEVAYRDVLPGVHFVFKNENGKFKYDIVLEETANRAQLSLQVFGAETITQTNNLLVFHTPLGSITENIPVSYIETNGKRKSIHDVRFTQEKNTIRFSFPTHTNNKKIIIDPIPSLMWGTYYGGSGIDMVLNVATDKLGNVLAVGQTMSTNNIATLGSHQATYTGDFDMFLVKFNKQGVRQWATYYGGLDTDRAYAICTDNANNIYVGGSTYSTTNIVTPGAWQTVFEGPDDAFLAKFNPSGVRQWGTYYGGELHDFIASMTADNNGNILLTGHSRSTFNIATPGTHQPSKIGVENCIISKFSSNGNLLWGTYYGNGAIDEGWGIVVDAANNIYVAGWTESTSNIATPGSFQPTYAGNMDGFLTRFTTNGQQVWGTYFGGSSIDRIWNLAIDDNNNLFFTGDTESNSPIATNGAWQTAKGSYDEGFLQKFNANGQRIWGTFIGGNSADYIYGVKTLKNSNDVIVAGYTESDVNISTPKAFQPARSGAYDAFAMSFSNNGQRLWGTYYGGTDTEECRGLAIAENNNIILGGHTFSAASIANNNGHQQSHGGGMFDGFVAKLCLPILPQFIAPDSICLGDTLLITIGNQAFTSYLWHDNSTFSYHQYSTISAGTYTYWITTIDTNNCPGESDTLTVTILPSPAMPIITQIGNMLQSSLALAYQWYYNGNPIPGANGQTHTPQQDGAYMVEITDSNGCKAVSEIHLFVGIHEYASGKFVLFPNPASSMLYVYANNSENCKRIEIWNALGNKVYTSEIISCEQKIDVSLFANGIYHVKLHTLEEVFTLKFVR